MNLKDKVVLVTGSTRGIGLAIAKLFSQLGARVVLHGRSAVSPEVLADFPADTLTLQADLADADSVSSAINDLYEQVESVDVLVNNAGIVDDKLAMGMSAAEFANVVNVNLNGTFNVTQPVFKKMLRARSGVIINMASVVGEMGNVGQVNYAASKAGVIGMTKTLAREGAKRGVRVNAIAPGMIMSDMTSGLSERVQAAMIEAIPLHRIGDPSEIAQTAMFLAQNEYITGQVITVDGGLYI
ncbi:3-oxoacyl-[acyl-carrier-protein] reductase [Weissella oryzae SG25]|uniref:3-oxoacyl-[acyl-carrier-protein] reductase n=1 Tax=Weissella oryzae (strain DSM 25784 / JCM 18191 / LMG 30913 / SG25) TaxID=1329250 RepID=A0A069CW34_WEIOS|nr:3-oxoacyl-ACP reductase FabG [Weissella oryzae]GAK31679.1 3-oxoacyl-[acyl-carrier-protein] reductase [Weissella oryzae SG25]